MTASHQGVGFLNLGLSGHVVRRGVAVTLLATAVVGSGAFSLAKPPPPPPPAPPSFRYDIFYLPRMPGGTFSTAQAMNNHNEIVGEADSDFAPTQATLWTLDGGLVYITSLIDPAQRCTFWIAHDINDAGQITGYAYFDTDGDGIRDLPARAVRFNPDTDGDGYGTVQTLGVPALPGGQRGTSINEQGDIVGNYWDENGNHHVFHFNDIDGFVDLGPESPSAANIPNAISDRDANGRVVMVGRRSNQYGWIADWTPGVSAGTSITLLPPRYSDRRTPGYSLAYDVNRSGQVAGETSVSREDVRAGRYTTSTGWTNLGTLAPASASNWNDSWANAINNLAITVGGSQTGGTAFEPNGRRAFIHADAFGIWDLASLVDNLPAASAGLLETPADINENNAVCGPWVENFTDVETRPAYLLVPKPVTP